jgi:sugar/nucleoside kinase (ribokinase family)
MSAQKLMVVVAGHVCLDVIPAFDDLESNLDSLLAPGKLVKVGPALTATGGAVSNTGLALRRLGMGVRLVGKVGDDLFGDEILNRFAAAGEQLADDMIVRAGDATSYSIVINLPHVDRAFLHCPGANDTFCAADVTADLFAGARFFHFGYPPIMRRIYEEDGAELAALLRRARAAGLTTSLDMAYPDPDSEAGRVDWPAFLANVLPHVDLFFPSIEEIAFMLGESDAAIDGALLRRVAERLLGWGTAVVVLKLGDQGLYLHTASAPRRLAAAGLGESHWPGRELLAPCYQTHVVGATGAGDCTIAGFLTGLLHGFAPEAVMNGAVAVGAFNVESADATSSIPDWATVQERMAQGWQRRETIISLPGWQWRPAPEVWAGPKEQNRSL